MIGTANFDLPMEAERGLDSNDNHLCVGEVTPAARCRANGAA